MNKKFHIALLLCTLFLLFFHNIAHTKVTKYVGVGKLQSKFYDTTEFGEPGGRHYHGFYYTNDFGRGFVQSGGWHLAARDWTDQNGVYHSVGMAAAANQAINEDSEIMPVPDSDGLTIKKYVRYQPPTITVDGMRIDEMFPMEGDEVNPDIIPGTADVMVVSKINTSLGVTIKQRVLAWSQTNHDDYIIEEYTIINTGNVDLDDEIELPDQVLHDLYFLRDNRFRDDYMWALPEYRGNWHSCYGERPGDSLRINYGYPTVRSSSNYDEFGYADQKTGMLVSPEYVGEVFLHVDKSANDHSDDPTQPQMTGSYTCDSDLFFRKDATSSTEQGIYQNYQLMQFGFHFDNIMMPYMEGTYEGTHHTLRMDEMDYKYTTDLPWNAPMGICVSFSACGPYTLQPGDSIKIAWALVMGSLSPEKSWEIGTAWEAGNCTWDGPDDLADYYPTYRSFPEVAPTENDRAKDRWVCTGKDSLFRNAANAVWNYQHGFNVPIPPPPPSIEVTSMPDRIRISWGSESESTPDFAGYRVYKAIANPGPVFMEDTLLGSWNKIFECGEGTDNALTHTFYDVEAKRGQAYYYYVTAFDNGVANEPDVWGQGESLESGKYLNRTTGEPPALTRQAGTSLSSIRVVPNPYNISASELQYLGEPDKIMFMDLPVECTIRIFTESGDLVRTIEHFGSGDESWGILTEEHLTSETGQIVVSGIYIANIQTPEGESTNVKFIVVR
jgi:hypothetical protein